MTNFDISKLSYDFYRYDNGIYCARFSYPDDNGDILSVNFEFCESYYRSNECVLWYSRCDTFLSYSSLPSSLDFFPTNSLYPSVYVVDLPTVFGYSSSRGKWLRSGSHHTRLCIDFGKLFAF